MTNYITIGAEMTHYITFRNILINKLTFIERLVREIAQMLPQLLDILKNTNQID